MVSFKAVHIYTQIYAYIFTMYTCKHTSIMAFSAVPSLGSRDMATLKYLRASCVCPSR